MKHRLIKITWLLTTLLPACNCLQAQITLPAVFTDNMVLQRQSDVSVWGWGNASATIQIVGSWAPQDTVKTAVAPDGKWSASIKTAQAGGPYTLEVLSGGNKHTIRQVMLGEVWLCSGQSNMEWQPRNGIMNKEAEMQAANYPDIRFFTVAKRGADHPQENCEGKWESCTPETMERSSAVAYFFGRRLYQTLGVPVGLIISAWGGTPAEVWVPQNVVEQNTELNSNKPKQTFPWWPVESGKLYNQMIHPLVPYRIAGTIWYQGESNQDRYQSYNALMKTLISEWRKGFGHDFPFYFVQIAPHTYNASGNTPALLREQQERTSLEMSGTGMVVISDIVNDVKNIHPTNKQDVGLRLANMALAKNYGQDIKGYQSPTYHSMTINRNKAVISFRNADEGLSCRAKKITGIKIAGADGTWVDGNAQIVGSTIVVSSPQVKRPTKVAYCFDEATIGNLFSKSGLPVAPFCTERSF